MTGEEFEASAPAGTGTMAATAPPLKSAADIGTQRRLREVLLTGDLARSEIVDAAEALRRSLLLGLDELPRAIGRSPGDCGTGRGIDGASDRSVSRAAQIVESTPRVAANRPGLPPGSDEERRRNDSNEPRDTGLRLELPDIGVHAQPAVRRDAPRSQPMVPDRQRSRQLAGAAGGGPASSDGVSVATVLESALVRQRALRVELANLEGAIGIGRIVPEQVPVLAPPPSSLRGPAEVPKSGVITTPAVPADRVQVASLAPPLLGSVANAAVAPAPEIQIAPSAGSRPNRGGVDQLEAPERSDRDRRRPARSMPGRAVRAPSPPLTPPPQSRPPEPEDVIEEFLPNPSFGPVTSPPVATAPARLRASFVCRAKSSRSARLAALRAVVVTMLLFVVYALYGSGLTEGIAQRGLSPATHLRISAVDVGIDQLVLGSDSKSALTKGPGLVPGSGVPGGTSPVVIVGHRTANGGPFRHLSALKPGQLIVVRAADGSTMRYDVERSLTVTPHATITETPGPQALYLVSGEPAYRDTRRIVVVARLDAGSPQPSPQSVTLPGLGGSPLDLVFAVIVLASLGLLWGARAVRHSTLPRWAGWAAWLPAIVLAYESWQLLLGSMSRLL